MKDTTSSKEILLKDAIHLHRHHSSCLHQFYHPAPSSSSNRWNYWLLALKSRKEGIVATKFNRCLSVDPCALATLVIASTTLSLTLFTLIFGVNPLRYGSLTGQIFGDHPHQTEWKSEATGCTSQLCHSPPGRPKCRSDRSPRNFLSCNDDIKLRGNDFWSWPPLPNHDCDWKLA